MNFALIGIIRVNCRLI